MSGFGFGKILRDILGGDISKMSEDEFASAIEKNEERPTPEISSLDELKGKRIREWGCSPFDVGLVRFVVAPGVEPCACCSSVVGKYAKPIDADFFFEHAQNVSHPAPFCLAAEPATMPCGGPEAPLPKHAVDEEGNILDGMALNRIDTAIYEENHPEEGEEDGPPAWAVKRKIPGKK